MNALKQLCVGATFFLTLGVVAPAYSAECTSTPPNQDQYLKAIQLGFETAQYLEKEYLEHGDTVVLIARIGSLTPIKRFTA